MNRIWVAIVEFGPGRWQKELFRFVCQVDKAVDEKFLKRIVKKEVSNVLGKSCTKFGFFLKRNEEFHRVSGNYQFGLESEEDVFVTLEEVPEKRKAADLVQDVPVTKKAKPSANPALSKTGSSSAAPKAPSPITTPKKTPKLPQLGEEPKSRSNSVAAETKPTKLKKDKRLSNYQNRPQNQLIPFEEKTYVSKLLAMEGMTKGEIIERIHSDFDRETLQKNKIKENSKFHNKSKPELIEIYGQLHQGDKVEVTKKPKTDVKPKKKKKKEAEVEKVPEKVVEPVVQPPADSSSSSGEEISGNESESSFETAPEPVVSLKSLQKTKSIKRRSSAVMARLKGMKGSESAKSESVASKPKNPMKKLKMRMSHASTINPDIPEF